MQSQNKPRGIMSRPILSVGILINVLITLISNAQELNVQEYSTKASPIKTPSNSCPTTFYDLTLPGASKQCRLFGVKKPSTLSLFVVATPENVAKGLSQQLSNATNSRKGDMFTLVSNKPKYRVYVFKDGQGTQVNIRAE